MTDYGLIAYNRTEEINREKLQHKFLKNLQNFCLPIKTNSLTTITTLHTNENEPITFEVAIHNRSYTIEVYVNNEINYICKTFENAKFSLYLSNTSNIAIKIISLNETETLNLSLIGNYDCEDIKQVKIFSGIKNHTAVVTVGEITKLIESQSEIDLTEKINNFDGAELLGTFICGLYIEDVFYCFYNKNNMGYLIVNNNIISYSRAFKNNCVAISDSNSTYPITLLENEFGIVTLTQLSKSLLTGEVKTMEFPISTCVKEIFNVNKLPNTNFNYNYVLVKDSLNYFFLVLCNFDLSALNLTKYPCIALGLNGKNANGYVLSNSNLSVIICGNFGATEIEFNILNKVTKPEKLNIKKYKNLSTKHYVSKTNFLLNFKGNVK